MPSSPLTSIERGSLHTSQRTPRTDGLSVSKNTSVCSHNVILEVYLISDDLIAVEPMTKEK